MSELAVREAAVVALPQHHAASDLMQWAQGVQAASDIVKALWGSPFIPAQYVLRRVDEDTNKSVIDHQASLAACTAAIVTGAAVGLDPLASLRSIDVISGTPAFRAVALRGIAQSAGHEIWTQETTSTRAIVCGRRRGSTHVESSTWDMDRARAMNLAGKPEWRKQPATMLMARATADVVRRVAAAEILGLPYAAEELGEGGEPDAAGEPETVAPAAAKRTARRAPVTPPTPAPAPAASEPDFEPEPDPPPAPAAEPDGDLITAPQSRKLAVLFRDAELDRDARLGYVSDLLGRDVQSSKELTKAEASQVIDALEQELADGTPVEAEQDPFPEPAA